MNIFDFGTCPDTTAYAGVPARVTAVHRERYEVVCQHGLTHARLKSAAYFAGEELFPTAGDWVMLHYVDNGDSLITATLPRRTYFARRDPTPGRGEQAVAANFDYVFIMQSLNLDFNPRRLERYLTLAWQSGASPVVLLTKADLVEDYWPFVTAVERVAAGVPVHVVSAHTGYGLQRLNAYLQPGKTVVFLGSSGVGKSSLVNALAGEDIMAVNAIREAGCEVVGMLANFTYEFPLSIKRFRDAGVRMIPLCTYSAMLEAAQDAHYIRPEDMETLQQWRRDPANWVLNR